MVCSKHDMKKWKSEQVSYFKKYLQNFDENSKQYSILTNGIAELEKMDI